MKPRIVFLDCTTPSPYDAESLLKVPLGGTEATCIRIAEALAGEGYDVVVAQHNRLTQGQGKANYTSFEALEHIHGDPKAVIALRDPKLIAFARERWTDSKFFLWAHDFNQQELVKHFATLEEASAKILAVSRFHKSIITDALLSQVETVRNVRVDFIYNPVADDLLPDNSTTYHKRLVFFSSPHKGLKNTLEAFKHIRERDSHYQLYIANPGYLPDLEGALPEGVTNLGSLPHAGMMQELRQAFAVLHVNPVFPETFGLVHAESQAVGVPVITHRFGANTEVLNPFNAQIVDCRDVTKVIDRLDLWQRRGRPQVFLKPEMRLGAVVSRWRSIIE